MRKTCEFTQMPHGGLLGGADAYVVHNNMNVDPYLPPRAVVVPVHTPGLVGLSYRALNRTYGRLSLPRPASGLLWGYWGSLAPCTC